jgi:preprotein translocase subunit SecB
MLSLTPENFRALRVNFAPSGELDLELGNARSSLSIEALKASANKVTIVLHLKLLGAEDFALSVDFAADFKVEDKSIESFEVNDQILLNTFIQVNAPAIAYPFLRAYISTITVNSGVSQILLPPVNFQALFDKKRAANAVPTPTILQ